MAGQTEIAMHIHGSYLQSKPRKDSNVERLTVERQLND